MYAHSSYAGSANPINMDKFVDQVIFNSKTQLINRCTVIIAKINQRMAYIVVHVSFLFVIRAETQNIGNDLS